MISREALSPIMISCPVPKALSEQFLFLLRTLSLLLISCEKESGPCPSFSVQLGNGEQDRWSVFFIFVLLLLPVLGLGMECVCVEKCVVGYGGREGHMDALRLVWYAENPYMHT